MPLALKGLLDVGNAIILTVTQLSRDESNVQRGHWDGGRVIGAPALKEHEVGFSGIIG